MCAHTIGPMAPSIDRQQSKPRQTPLPIESSRTCSRDCNNVWEFLPHLVHNKQPEKTNEALPRNVCPPRFNAHPKRTNFSTHGGRSPEVYGPSRSPVS